MLQVKVNDLHNLNIFFSFSSYKCIFEGQFFTKIYYIMKKVLLTFFIGLCIGSVATAQDPAKATKKKALKTTIAPDYSKVYPKEARAKAIEAGKPVPAVAEKAKAPVAAEKAN